MKKVLVLTVVLFSFLVFPGKSFGQGEFGRVTPQTADFMRYGDISVGLNTGNSNYEVPIFTIKTANLSLPISLCYVSDGFKPNKRPSSVGYNWTLNAGGLITREVYLAPDDAILYEQSEISNYDLTGYNVLRKAGITHTQSELYYLTVPPFAQDPWAGIPYIPYTTDRMEDTMPDLFSFNFFGHKGEFMIGNDGNVVVSDDGYKVDLSRMTNQPYKVNGQPQLPDTSQITITAPDGTVFVFGHIEDESLSSIEFSRSFGNQNDTNDHIYFTQPVINAWHLTRMYNIHGDEITFEYSSPNITGFTPYNANNFDSSIWQTTMELNSNYEEPHTYSETKSVFLERISVNDGTAINFYKSREGYNFYPTMGDYGILTVPYLDYDRPMYQIDSIVVSSNRQRIYQYALGYESKERTNTGAKLRFLKSVTVDNHYQYGFTYNHPSGKYPDPVASSQTTNGYLSSSSSNDKGVLTRIDYPTGGYTLLQFENHDYGARVERYSMDSHHVLPPALNEDPPQESIGGLRIKKTENYDSNNTLLSFKQYYYVSDTILPILLSAAQKSGIYLHHPPYASHISGVDTHLGNISKNYNINDTHIAYSHVLEHSGVREGYKRYSFTDYKDYPDKDVMVHHDSVVNFDPFLVAGINKFTSASRKRGLLKEIKYFNASGVSIGYESYGYNPPNIIQPINPYPPAFFDAKDVVIVHCVQGHALPMKIKIDKPLLLHKTVKLGADAPTQVTVYKYNDYDLLAKETTLDSNNDSIAVSTKYAGDMTGGVFNTMKANWWLSYPVEIVTRKGGAEISRQENTYTGDGKRLAAQYVSKSGGALRQIISYDLYNSRGRVLQTTTPDGLVRSYLWDSNIHYPIAEVVNATYSQIQNILMANLRTSLPNAMVTTYTYKPLMGVSSVTDPQGIKTYYEYDALGRLKSIKDHNNNIIEGYEYHYKQ